MVLSTRSGRRDSPMTRGLAVPPPARPSWPDATLYEVRPHQKSCIMVPRSGDPLQERSGRLEKMSFAAPWRIADNMGLHGGRQARAVALRRAPYLRTRPQCPRARTPNARSPRAPPRRVARGVDAPAPHRHAIGPGRRRTGGQAPGATVTSPLTRTSPLSAAHNLSEGLLGRFVI